MGGDMAGWIILGVVLVLFLAAPVIAFTWGSKWKLPDGTQVEGNYRGFKSVLVYGPKAEAFFGGNTPQVVANGCALAMWSIGTAWDARKRPKAPGSEKFRFAVVHVLDDEEYDRLYDGEVNKIFHLNVRSNGMLQSVFRRMRPGSAPLVACRASAFVTTPLTGSLVIHELTHFVISHTGKRPPLDPYDRNHSLNEFWWGKDKDALEVASTETYIAHRHEVGVNVA